jgi:mRNA interferase MazF
VRRGDIVLTALPGDYGKPRPTVVVQSDWLNQSDCSSVVVCPMTSFESDLSRIRIVLAPTAENGLSARSGVVVDFFAAVPVRRLRRVIGRIAAEHIRRLDRAFLVVLGFA